MNLDMDSYYGSRAREYEKVYEKPERQTDLVIAKEYLLSTFNNLNVLEIACGTGYWTQKISTVAKGIFANYRPTKGTLCGTT